MIWLGYIILLLVAAIGWFLVLLLWPGLFLMTAAAATYALFTHGHYLGWKSLLVLLVLSGLGELIELWLGNTALRRAGGGSGALTGATVGGVAGGIFLAFLPIPVLGTLLGVCLGTFLGAASVELMAGSAHRHSLGVGWGAVKGRLGGLAVKLLIGGIMLLAILICAFP